MTQQHKLIVENLKCGGCTSTIIKQLSAIDDVEKVQVNSESDMVSFVAPVERLALVRQRLRTLGYPEQGSVSGLPNISAKARSFVSCVIGKVGVE
jgi:copper chaperone